MWARLGMVGEWHVAEVLRPASVGVVLIAAAALGFETGWLTGHSGPDPSVLQSLIPALLGAGAGGVGVLTAGVLRLGGSRVGVAGLRGVLLVVAGAAVLFVFAFHVGVSAGTAVLHGKIRRGEDLNLTAEVVAEGIRRQEAALRLGRLYDYVGGCREVRKRINEARRRLGVEAISVRQACPAVAATDLQKPGAVLLEENVESLLTPRALEMHEEYLEECTIQQVREIGRAGDPAVSGQLVLGEVCAGLESGSD